MPELFPVPAALVGKDGIGAANALFHQAGLAAGTLRRLLETELAPRLAALAGSGETSARFAWQIGDPVDRRHFDVLLARHASDWIVSLVDQTGEHRNADSLRREMMTDSLTGLPNRAAFDEAMEARCVEAGAGRCAVLALDLVRFARINACMGALAGDELLITLARRLKGALRASDVLARTGGDEFAILLTLDDDREEALYVANRIQAALGAPFRLTDFEIRVACAIGVAFGADADDAPQELIRHAQFAVKSAKTSGRTEIYQPDAFVEAREAFGLETELRRAVEGGLLRLTYQPICDLATGRIVAMEALARWTDSRGVSHAPTDFIPVAEESGLIVPLGRWAIDEAARTLAGWDKAMGGDCGISVGINISAIQLYRDSIAPVVEAALDASGLEGRRLTLELTESALIADPDRTAATMHALKALGTTLAMDDFGTGYSNLAYLQKLPIDVLKIDRSLVTGMLADRDKVAIVRAILSLAQALGMKTTAEGVETNELAQTLAALGCTFGQGFFYARPLEADQAWALLDSRRH